VSGAFQFFIIDVTGVVSVCSQVREVKVWVSYLLFSVTSQVWEDARAEDIASEQILHVLAIVTSHDRIEFPYRRQYGCAGLASRALTID
jgi:hypothetical protein